MPSGQLNSWASKLHRCSYSIPTSWFLSYCNHPKTIAMKCASKKQYWIRSLVIRHPWHHTHRLQRSLLVGQLGTPPPWYTVSSNVRSDPWYLGNTGIITGQQSTIFWKTISCTYYIPEPSTVIIYPIQAQFYDMRRLPVGPQQSREFFFTTASWHLKHLHNAHAFRSFGPVIVTSSNQFWKSLPQSDQKQHLLLPDEKLQRNRW